MGRLDKLLDGVNSVLAFLAGLLLIFVTVSICVSIMLRALDMQSPLWSVQFNEYSLLWITFLGAPWLLRRGGHVSLDIITRRLSERGAMIMRRVHALLGLGVCGVLSWITIRVTWDHYLRQVMDVRAVDVPKHLILAVVAVGFVLLTLEFLRKLFMAGQEQEEGE
jgi:TRAP-type C4-dicarboxylate transport system permease small subunit